MENQPQIKFLPSRFLLVITVLILSALACQTLVAAPSSPESPAVTVATPEQVVEPVVDQPTESSPAATRPPSPSRDTDDENAPPVSVAPQFIPPNSLVELYERVSPGVVSIQTISEQGSRSSGSGFVIDNEGHLVTNYHVIEGANELEVNFPDGVKVRGTVLGTDLDSDLAIIKVDVPPEQLHPLPLGSSEQVKVGQVVVAIGNPFGLSGTMTVGIISAKGRVLNSMKAAPGGGIFSA
ncbi:MAG: S1C family serine protease, partial [Anaerolineales bacterium]